MERYIRLWGYALGSVLAVTSAHASQSVSIKNFREIYASYESVTGVSGKAQDLNDLYRSNIDRLPKTGHAGELSSSVILAMTELGGAFCKKAIDREKNQSYGERILFYDVDFARGPSQFTSYLREVIAENMGYAFWQRNLSEDEKAAISNIIVNASKGSQDTPVETEKVLHILCASYSTSLAFLVK